MDQSSTPFHRVCRESGLDPNQVITATPTILWLAPDNTFVVASPVPPTRAHQGLDNVLWYGHGDWLPEADQQRPLHFILIQDRQASTPVTVFGHLSRQGPRWTPLSTAANLTLPDLRNDYPRSPAVASQALGTLWHRRFGTGNWYTLMGDRDGHARNWQPRDSTQRTSLDIERELRPLLRDSLSL